MARRRFLAQLVAWPLATLLPVSAFASPRAAPLKIMLKSAWGSDNPTKAAFPFSHGHALAEAELLGKVVERKIPIYACGTCSRARGISEADLANWGANYGNPKIFVSLIEWADRVITE